MLNILQGKLGEFFLDTLSIIIEVKSLLVLISKFSIRRTDSSVSSLTVSVLGGFRHVVVLHTKNKHVMTHGLTTIISPQGFFVWINVCIYYIVIYLYTLNTLNKIPLTECVNTSDAFQDSIR